MTHLFPRSVLTTQITVSRSTAFTAGVVVYVINPVLLVSSWILLPAYTGSFGDTGAWIGLFVITTSLYGVAFYLYYGILFFKTLSTLTREGVPVITLNVRLMRMLLFVQWFPIVVVIMLVLRGPDTISFALSHPQYLGILTAVFGWLTPAALLIDFWGLFYFPKRFAREGLSEAEKVV